MQYTKRMNLNRGYLKLEVWQRGIDLFELVFRLAETISDFKLKSQFADAAQSVSANIAEGYGRRTLPEYLNSCIRPKVRWGQHSRAQLASLA